MTGLIYLYLTNWAVVYSHPRFIWRVASPAHLRRPIVDYSDKVANSFCIRSKGGKYSSTASSMRTIAAGRPVFKAATVLPRVFLRGTAMDLSPISTSWSILAYPSWRTRSNSSRIELMTVSVYSVRLDSVEDSRTLCASTSGSAASNTRPMEVQYAGNREPGIKAIDITRVCAARAM